MKFMVWMMLALVSVSAFALTLAEKKKQKYWEDEIAGKEGQGYAKTFKDKCGYDLPVTMEEKMVTPFLEANTSLSSYCDAPRAAMSSMCEADKMNKDAITAKIKKVDCKLGEKGKVDMKLSGSTLVFTVGLDAANLEDAVKTFLDKSL